jgi:hypothetical protein
MPKMKVHADFDAFEKDQRAGHRKILRALRRFVRRVAPDLREDVKWGNGCWVCDEGPVAYTHCEADCVQFGFVHGSALEDPKGLLEGNGRFVRFTRLRAVADLDARAHGALLREAARTAPARWAAVRKRLKKRR